MSKSHKIKGHKNAKLFTEVKYSDGTYSAGYVPAYKKDDKWVCCAATENKEEAEKKAIEMARTHSKGIWWHG